MNSISKSKELVVSQRTKSNLPVKFEGKSDIFALVENDVFLKNREQVKKILPDILGRVLARIWIDASFKKDFKENPIKTLNKYGVFLPDEMYLEFQKPDTKRPKIIVYEKKENSNFKIRVAQLQLIMMAGR